MLISKKNKNSNKDNKDKELPSLEELEDLFNVYLYNYLKLIVEDVNKIDSLAKGIDITTIP